MENENLRTIYDADDLTYFSQVPKVRWKSNNDIINEKEIKIKKLSI